MDFFHDAGVELNFFFSKKARGFSEADCVFINSNVFRPAWQKDKPSIFRFLEEAAKDKAKIFWFDTTDSTWCTQFEVLPYVDCLLKSQTFADKTMYLNKYRTGRIFTDAFDELYHSGEPDTSTPMPDPSMLHKLSVSWNTCFENYNESRYGLACRLRQKLRRFTVNSIPERLDINFTDIPGERPIDISCRLGLSHSRPSVLAHRKAVIEVMSKFGVDCSKIPLKDYFEELRNAKIGIGPFGVGEITLRDFEIIICGAALVKPDISHMETWPELFQVDKTFVAHKWDLSDLEEKLALLRDDTAMRTRMAWDAQQTYRRAVSPEGLKLFVGRLLCIIESKMSQR